MSQLADEAMYFGAVADGVESQQEEIAELRQQLADVRNQVLEECAAVAEDTAAGRDAEAIADAIRAMKYEK